MSYLSYYLETCDSDAQFFLPALLTDKEKHDLIISFRVCGGVSQRVHIVSGKPSKRFIISKWQSETDYYTWLRNPLSQTYINRRDEHNREHEITSMLIGVFQE
jgi:hypothetical protein